MNAPLRHRAERIADAALRFHREQTGHAPRGATAAFDQEVLLVTLYQALSPAERVLAQSPAGAATVEQYYRRLYGGSVKSLIEDIEKILGIPVRESGVIVETTGHSIHTFASGTAVQVFELAEAVSEADWTAPVAPDSKAGVESE